jgi:DNA-binding NarL/FixJ family response regulator
MPLLNGAEAATVLKRIMPHVPIILFTMYDFGEIIAKAVGVDVVLSKPQGTDQLAACLKRFLGNPSSASSDLSTETPSQLPPNPESPTPD